ncbi:hypothetical protein [Comamonas odontotermitis]|uniref:hypothetical protein n=1 Tax=Comamonas odontotermitis TaxID=379895 RepID=UPI001CC6CDBB|nr:hypothetical protein [Comamonas odontotermitis]UBB18546.1 hypothetical protein LAD35_07895 [Comamonas odontotermitis]
MNGSINARAINQQLDYKELRDEFGRLAEDCHTALNVEKDLRTRRKATERVFTTINQYWKAFATVLSPQITKAEDAKKIRYNKRLREALCQMQRTRSEYIAVLIKMFGDRSEKIWQDDAPRLTEITHVVKQWGQTPLLLDPFRQALNAYRDAKRAFLELCCQSPQSDTLTALKEVVSDKRAALLERQAHEVESLESEMKTDLALHAGFLAGSASISVRRAWEEKRECLVAKHKSELACHDQAYDGQVQRLAIWRECFIRLRMARFMLGQCIDVVPTDPTAVTSLVASALETMGRFQPKRIRGGAPRTSGSPWEVHAAVRRACEDGSSMWSALKIIAVEAGLSNGGDGAAARAASRLVGRASHRETLMGDIVIAHAVQKKR